MTDFLNKMISVRFDSILKGQFVLMFECHLRRLSKYVTYFGLAFIVEILSFAGGLRNPLSVQNGVRILDQFCCHLTNS